MVVLERLIVGSYRTNCYIFGDNKEKNVFLIDPGNNGKEIIAHLTTHNFTPIGVLITHNHFDHTAAVNQICKNYDIPLYASAKIHSYQYSITHRLFEGDILTIGKEILRVLEAPGHESGALNFIDKYNQLVFVGDNIFEGSIGKTNSDSNYELLISSIKKLFADPEILDTFTLLPGHGSPTQVFQEKLENPFLRHYYSIKPSND